MSEPLIMLAAGGTGGHIFPAEALAESLLARGCKVVLVTDHRFHDYNKNSGEGVLGKIPIHTIRAGSLGGRTLDKAKQSASILQGIFQARKLIRQLQPAAVVGFGGYPSFPTMVAALSLKRVTLIHEQNSVLGRVNRLLAKRVNAVAAAYDTMLRVPKGTCVAVTGNPVRATVRALNAIPYPDVSEGGMLRVLVTGGSQGASVFSRVVPDALKLLAPELRARIRLDQQCRAGELEQVRAKYVALSMQVDLAPFFTDVAARLAATHLVVCRAGASTVAELMVAGRPALLVPLPQATDNHQYYNAQAVEDAGAGWVIAQPAFTPEALAARLETLLRAPKRLSECAAAMRGLGQPEAADVLASLVLKTAGVSATARAMESAA